MKFIYVFLFITSTLYSQNTKEVYKEYHDNGQVKILGELIQIDGWEGKSKVGDWKEFDKDENLIKIITYSIFGARPIQIKTFENNLLNSHIVYDIARYKKFEFDVLKTIYTVYDENGDITAKAEVFIDNQKLKDIDTAITNSSKQGATYFKDIVEGVIFSDGKYKIKKI